jgi:hypothetical protein
LGKGRLENEYVVGTYGFLKDMFKINRKKAVKVTGVDYTPYEKSVLDAAKAFERYL